jgi:activator of 2-hydroxyglutaryl-CoA dehydratase
MVTANPLQSANAAMNLALSSTHIRLEEVQSCVSTGYGRERIPFACQNFSEISCHGKGALGRPIHSHDH